MPSLQPFEPDAQYCVYCHAPASGPCARCGALCCADCVELVMGWTTRRAICRSCAEGEDSRTRRHRLPRWLATAAAAALIAAGALWLAWLRRG